MHIAVENFIISVKLWLEKCMPKWFFGPLNYFTLKTFDVCNNVIHVPGLSASSSIIPAVDSSGLLLVVDDVDDVDDGVDDGGDVTVEVLALLVSKESKSEFM